MTVSTEALGALIIEQTSCEKAGKPLQSMFREGLARPASGWDFPTCSDDCPGFYEQKAKSTLAAKLVPLT